MVQALTATLLFLTEVFELCTCSPSRLFHGMGQARIETNIYLIFYLFGVSTDNGQVAIQLWPLLKFT